MVFAAAVACADAQNQWVARYSWSRGGLEGTRGAAGQAWAVAAVAALSCGMLRYRRRLRPIQAGSSAVHAEAVQLLQYMPNSLPGDREGGGGGLRVSNGVGPPPGPAVGQGGATGGRCSKRKHAAWQGQ